MRLHVGLGGLAVLLVTGAVACGGSKRSAPAADSLERLKVHSRQAMLIFGTSDYGPGRLRVSFLLTRADGSLILQQRARVWIATDDRSPPLGSALARLEKVTASGAQISPAGTTRLYVANITVHRAGTYQLLAEPIGSRWPYAARASLLVKKQRSALAVGSQAPASATPTVSSANGHLRAITTHVPPDRALLRYSVRESLAAHKPFVLVFGTPAFCANRTCGPIVDVVDAVRLRFQGSGVRFIHVEPFTSLNPGLGFNRWAREWRIPSEPYTFVVGRDGRVKAEFEGSISVQELTAAMKATVAHPPAAGS